MAKTKIEIVGVLRRSDEAGLQCSLRVGKKGQMQDVWLDALPVLEREWPEVGKYPKKPEPQNVTGPNFKAISAANKAAEENWKRACDAFEAALYASAGYRAAVDEFLSAQQKEPQLLEYGISCWAYRDKVVRIESSEPEPVRDPSAEALAIKHYVLRRDRNYERMKREVDALENMEKLERTPREPIAESVRLFVWQRDKGQCVKCGSNQKLEFDHIIPVVSGGSSTERNIQLLCETCNRSKGAAI